MSILQDIGTSADLKKLNIDQLKNLAEEIRTEILGVTKQNGGHLSSNLGIVETTIALHYVFDLPTDKLIFDVGHQCYTHKLLSGRGGDLFKTIRKKGGISGFPDVEESPYDAFSTGHAGTSISAGLGMCNARDKLGQDYQVITLVGDGSLANGLNLEALNAQISKPKNYIVILNDNGMSISKNKNGFYKFISRSTTKTGYVKSKNRFKKIFGNSFITKFFRKIKNFLKRAFNRNNYFENLGFKYVGVFDGNDLKEMINILSRVKERSKDTAIFLHIKTTKGKGFDVAEENADTYHGVSRNFESASGGFGAQLGNTLNSVIQEDDRVVAITAGMKDGTGLALVENVNPKNFIDVGIAEEYAVTLSAGMAIGGLKPVVAIYSTFMQRAYDQMLHDVCVQNLPVVFCLDRAGMVGEDGKTHQGLFDLSFLSHLPNLTILTPACESELDGALKYALSLNSPVAIRYPKKGNGEGNFDNGKWSYIRQGKDYTVLAIGPRMINLGLELSKEIDCSVVAVRSVKPLDNGLLDGINGEIITLEENVLAGGFGQIISAYYSDRGIGRRIFRFGVKDEFIKHQSVEQQLEDAGLTVENIKRIIFNSK